MPVTSPSLTTVGRSANIDHEVLNFDKLTYAATLNTVASMAADERLPRRLSALRSGLKRTKRRPQALILFRIA